MVNCECLCMKKWVLPNGMTVLYEHRDTPSVTVQVLVNVGSDGETDSQRGIAHFMEHMVFEGTKKRENAKIITNEIERVGGVSNAYTTNARTCYHAKVPAKHFDIALDVTADMLREPLLRESDTQRQKHILFKEIDLVTDEPRFHQWIIFQKTMFLKHPSKNPTYGTREAVQKVKAADLRAFFEQYYYPGNMMIAIVGNVPDVYARVARAFGGGKRKLPVHWKHVVEPPQKKNRMKKEKRKSVASTYVALGHRTVARMHPDSVVLDVIDGILGRGQSGWMFDEIRNKAGLAYEVGTEKASEKDYGFYATYLSIDRKNMKKSIALVLEQLKKLEKVSEHDVVEAKMSVEGSLLLDMEDTQRMADELLYWEHIKDARELDKYIYHINNVTVADVRRVARTYFSKPHVLAVIEGK